MSQLIGNFTELSPKEGQSCYEVTKQAKDDRMFQRTRELPSFPDLYLNWQLFLTFRLLKTILGTTHETDLAECYCPSQINIDQRSSNSIPQCKRKRFLSYPPMCDEVSAATNSILLCFTFIFSTHPLVQFGCQEDPCSRDPFAATTTTTTTHRRVSAASRTGERQTWTS